MKPLLTSIVMLALIVDTIGSFASAMKLGNLRVADEAHRRLCNCQSMTVTLIAGGGNPKSTTDVGANLTDVGNALKVCIDTTLLGYSTAIVTHVHIQTGCSLKDFPLTRKGSPIPGHFDTNEPYEELDEEGCIEVNKPNCNPTLAAIHLDVPVLGAMDAVNHLFPQDGTFQLTGTDRGTNPTSSTWNAKIPAISPDTILRGHCVDVARVIDTGRHKSTFYSFDEPDDLPNGAIDKPWNLAAVAWLINNFHEGSTPTVDLGTHSKTLEGSPIGVAEPCGPGTVSNHTLSSGDIQLTIWLLVDDQPWRIVAGLGSDDESWACHMYHEALLHGSEFVPDCGDVCPLIMVATDDKRQRTIAQVTFAELQLPCDGHDETTWAVEPFDVLPTKKQGFSEGFPGRNWATYVELTCP